MTWTILLILDNDGEANTSGSMPFVSRGLGWPMGLKVSIQSESQTVRTFFAGAFKKKWSSLDHVGSMESCKLNLDNPFSNPTCVYRKSSWNIWNSHVSLGKGVHLSARVVPLNTYDEIASQSFCPNLIL